MNGGTHPPGLVHELQGHVRRHHVHHPHERRAHQRVVDDAHKEAVGVVEDGVDARQLLRRVEDHKRDH